MKRQAEAVAVESPLSASCLYVYGLVDQVTHPGLLVGATRGRELHLTRVGRVAAVHSWIDPAEFDDLGPNICEGSHLADLARCHDDVITALTAAGPVLPVRLGTLLPDRAALTRMLEKNEDDIAEALDRVRGRSEWHLRVIEPEPWRDPRAEDDAAGAGGYGEGRTGTSYLLGRRDARRRVRHERESLAAMVAALDESLAGIADASSHLGSAYPATLASRAYLVSHRLQDEFAAAGEQGITELERFGWAATLLGPLPAYSFVDIRLEAFRDD